MVHANKKITTDEWVAAIDDGKLRAVMKDLNPESSAWHWTMRCDGEKFLHAPASRKVYQDCKVVVWKIPAKSPDLNPIERFWSWLRQELHTFDMADLKAGRPVAPNVAYLQCLRNILRSARSQAHAVACAKSLRKVCKEVVLKKGAGSR